MIDSELRGKSPATEDCLTSSALGLLALLPDDAFKCFLRRARSVDRENLSIDDNSIMDNGEVEFWPWLFNAGEPDAIVTFAKDNVKHAILIEAKRDSPQSGEHQIARYALGFLRDRQYCEKLSVVYLTSHKLLPEEELRKEKDVFLQNKAEQNSLNFYWLSWKDLYLTILEWSEKEGLHMSEKRICNKLEYYLHELGYGCFRRFNVNLEDLIAVCPFWRGKPLLDMPNISIIRAYHRYWFGGHLHSVSTFWNGANYE